MAEFIGAYQVHIVEAGCAPGSGRYGVRIDVPNDISEIFPYLNAALDNAWYDPEGQVLIWRQPEQAYAFRRHEIMIARVVEPSRAGEMASDIVARTNAAWRDRHGIKPMFTTRSRPSTMDLFKLLPRTNCGRCGYRTCLAYAAALRAGETEVSGCLPLVDSKFAENRHKITALAVADQF
jgi:ArsR family metal-binding transcriptional regulator